MTGYLRIELSPDESARTYLSRQSVRAPMHLSKPYWDGSFLVINGINATAGLFSGDEIDIRVRATAGSRAVFTSPSACRVHRAVPSGGPAIVRNTFEVESGAWLDVYPEIFIPQAGSRYIQTTEI